MHCDLAITVECGYWHSGNEREPLWAMDFDRNGCTSIFVTVYSELRFGWQQVRMQMAIVNTRAARLA